MARQVLHLCLPDSLTEGALIDLLGTPGAVGSVVDDLPAAGGRKIYIDTFDWRLYRAGRTLHQEPDGDTARLVWSALADGRALVSVPAGVTLPKWGSELPEGAIREAVTPLLDIRALTPMVTLDGVLRPILLCDALGEICARITLDNLRASRRGGALQAVPRGLKVEILPGGEAVGAAAIDALTAAGCLVDEDGGGWQRALSTLGAPPASWSGKPDLALDPGQRADEALKQILAHLLDAVEANAEGIFDEVDIECLHDFRVSVRRTRSALSRLKDVLPEKAVSWGREEFAWLQEITGPARDFDVFAEDLPQMTADLPEALKVGVPPLARLIEDHRARANAEVCEALRTERYTALVARWREALSAEGKKKPKASKALIPIGELASARIWKAYTRVLNDGRAITDASPIDDLHELRKTVKKLRYLMEFFRRLYPAKKMARCIKILKQFQELLGRLNDAQVQHDFMLGLGPALKADASLPPETQMMAGVMVLRADQALAEGRAKFSERFVAFDTPKHFALFEGLFKG